MRTSVRVLGSFAVLAASVAVSAIVVSAPPAGAVTYSSQVTIDQSVGVPDRGDTGNAIDGSTDTSTYTTPSYNADLPSHLEVGFASTAVNRIRLYKEIEYGPHDLTIQYTTDTGDLTARTWQNVSGLTNGFEGDELLDATAVDPGGTVDEDVHSSAADGFASLSFDTVTATGLRVSFTTAHPNVHFLVFELQAWYDAGPGSITIVEDSVPDAAQDFGFTTTGGLTPSTFSLDDDADGTLAAQQVFSDLAPGEYSVTETDLTGWGTSVVCDTGESVVGATATITLLPAEDVTCTFTNAPTGSLTIVEDTEPDGEQDFAYSTEGGLTPSTFDLDDDADGTLAAQQVFADIAPGDYSVTQSSVAGFDTVLECDTIESIDGLTADVTVTAGESVTCTYTSTQRGSIRIVQDTQPDGPQDFGFTTVGSLPSSFALDDDSEATLENEVQFDDLPLAGYTLTQTAVAGFSVAVSCDGGGSGDGSTATIVLSPGEDVTCTFTSTRRRPDGQVRKATDAAFAGDDVYSTTTVPAQTKTQSVRRARTMSFAVRVGNDGGAADSFKIRGTAGSGGVTVRYLRGATNVTAAVVAGTYVQGPTNPGANTPVLTVQVTAAPGASLGTRTIKIMATSVALPSVKDVVTAKATVTA